MVVNKLFTAKAVEAVFGIGWVNFCGPEICTIAIKLNKRHPYNSGGRLGDKKANPDRSPPFLSLGQARELDRCAYLSIARTQTMDLIDLIIPNYSVLSIKTLSNSFKVSCSAGFP